MGTTHFRCKFKLSNFYISCSGAPAAGGKGPSTTIQDLEKMLQGPDVQPRIIGAAAKGSKDDSLSNQQPKNGAVSGLPTDTHASPAAEPLQASSNANIKSQVTKSTMHNVHMTEQLECKQRAGCKWHAKHDCVEQLEVICNHSCKVMMSKCARLHHPPWSCCTLIPCTHGERGAETDKHLKALKADDEEAHMKLTGTTKDVRIAQMRDTTWRMLAQAGTNSHCITTFATTSFSLQNNVGPFSTLSYLKHSTQSSRLMSGLTRHLPTLVLVTRSN